MEAVWIAYGIGFFTGFRCGIILGIVVMKREIL